MMSVTIQASLDFFDTLNKKNRWERALWACTPRKRRPKNSEMHGPIDHELVDILILLKKFLAVPSKEVKKGDQNNAKATLLTASAQEDDKTNSMEAMYEYVKKNRSNPSKIAQHLLEMHTWLSNRSVKAPYKKIEPSTLATFQGSVLTWACGWGKYEAGKQTQTQTQIQNTGENRPVLSSKSTAIFSVEKTKDRMQRTALGAFNNKNVFYKSLSQYLALIDPENKSNIDRMGDNAAFKISVPHSIGIVLQDAEGKELKNFFYDHMGSKYLYDVDGYEHYTIGYLGEGDDDTRSLLQTNENQEQNQNASSIPHKDYFDKCYGYLYAILALKKDNKNTDEIVARLKEILKERKITLEDFYKEVFIKLAAKNSWLTTEKEKLEVERNANSATNRYWDRSLNKRAISYIVDDQAYIEWAMKYLSSDFREWMNIYEQNKQSDSKSQNTNLIDMMPKKNNQSYHTNEPKALPQKELYHYLKGINTQKEYENSWYAINCNPIPSFRKKYKIQLGDLIFYMGVFAVTLTEGAAACYLYLMLAVKWGSFFSSTAWIALLGGGFVNGVLIWSCGRDLVRDLLTGNAFKDGHGRNLMKFQAGAVKILLGLSLISASAFALLAADSALVAFGFLSFHVGLAIGLAVLGIAALWGLFYYMSVSIVKQDIQKGVTKIWNRFFGFEYYLRRLDLANGRALDGLSGQKKKAKIAELGKGLNFKYGVYFVLNILAIVFAATVIFFAIYGSAGFFQAAALLALQNPQLFGASVAFAKGFALIAVRYIATILNGIFYARSVFNYLPKLLAHLIVCCTNPMKMGRRVWAYLKNPFEGMSNTMIVATIMSFVAIAVLSFLLVFNVIGQGSGPYSSAITAHDYLTLHIHGVLQQVLSFGAAVMTSWSANHNATIETFVQARTVKLNKTECRFLSEGKSFPHTFFGPVASNNSNIQTYNHTKSNIPKIEDTKYDHENEIGSLQNGDDADTTIKYDAPAQQTGGN